MSTVDPTYLRELVARALAEDLGSGDVTTRATVPEGTRGLARITQKAVGVFYGRQVLEEVVHQTDPGGRLEVFVDDGALSEPGTVIAEIEGDAAAILWGERTALNFLQRLSGVATLTHKYVTAVAGTGAQILDTRKTTPTLRALEKAAVAAGGGTNHRIGLYDMVLIKENHVEAAGGVACAVKAAQGAYPQLVIDVECETIEQVIEALEAGATRLLLDNMTLDQMRTAVQLASGGAELEASGGVTLDTVRSIAETGVDYISVGALTHSAPALDLSLLLERI